MIQYIIKAKSPKSELEKNLISESFITKRGPFSKLTTKFGKLPISKVTDLDGYITITGSELINTSELDLLKTNMLTINNIIINEYGTEIELIIIKEEPPIKVDEPIKVEEPNVIIDKVIQYKIAEDKIVTRNDFTLSITIT